MSNSVFIPTVLTVPATGGGTGTGQGEINLITDSIGAAGGTGWTNTMSSTVRDSSGSPLDPVVPTGWTLSSSATNQYFTSVALSVPGTLLNRKLKVEFYFNQVSGSGFRLEVARDSGFANKFALTTDVAGVTSIPATAGTKGKFTAYFDTDNTSPIYVRFVSVGTGVIKITNVVVGPGIQPQGAVVGEWVSFTPATPSGLVLGTGGSIAGRWRRVGDSAEIMYDVVLGTSGASLSSAFFALPTGVTIDTTKLTSANDNVTGVAYAYDASDSFKSYVGATRWSNASSGFTINFHLAGAISSTSPFTWAVNDQLKVRVTAPIAEWAGSGTVQLA